YSVDPRRIFVVGHSNGGFMAYRMACDHSDTVAAIVSVAGAMYDDARKCRAAHPVSVLQVHGPPDNVIPYQGTGINGANVPRATWSTSCSHIPRADPPGHPPCPTSAFMRCVPPRPPVVPGDAPLPAYPARFESPRHPDAR